MAKKKKRGRPRTTGTGQTIGVRILPPLMKQIDAWRETQERETSRPEAIRLLTQRGLESGK